MPEKIQKRLNDRYDGTNDARIWSVVLIWYDSIEKNNANKIQLLSKLNIIWMVKQIGI